MKSKHEKIMEIAYECSWYFEEIDAIMKRDLKDLSDQELSKIQRLIQGLVFIQHPRTKKYKIIDYYVYNDDAEIIAVEDVGDGFYGFSIWKRSNFQYGYFDKKVFGEYLCHESPVINQTIGEFLEHCDYQKLDIYR